MKSDSKFYTGIGSRETPDNVCQSMTIIAKVLNSFGYTLRSGHAPGADKAFEDGAGDLKEIFLPWEGFEGSDSEFTGPSDAAVALSRKLFPHFPGVSQGTRKLISRNMHQLFGPNIQGSPITEFVVCWTPDAKIVGGTAYALKAAKHFNIPVFNLASDLDIIRFSVKMRDIEEELK